MVAAGLPSPGCRLGLLDGKFTKPDFRYTKYTVFLACKQIHSKYTVKYTVVVVVGRPGGHMRKWSSPNPKLPRSSISAVFEVWMFGHV